MNEIYRNLLYLFGWVPGWLLVWGFDLNCFIASNGIKAQAHDLQVLTWLVQSTDLSV
jgi:hypothetical protein